MGNQTLLRWTPCPPVDGQPKVNSMASLELYWASRGCFYLFACFHLTNVLCIYHGFWFCVENLCVSASIHVSYAFSLPFFFFSILVFVLYGFIYYCFILFYFILFYY